MQTVQIVGPGGVQIVGPGCVPGGPWGQSKVSAIATQPQAAQLERFLSSFKALERQFGRDAVGFPPEEGEGPPGSFPFTFADLDAYTDSAGAVAAAIGGAVSVGIPNPHTDTLGDVISRTAQLLKAWRAQLALEQKPPRKITSGLVIASGIGIGLAVLGAVVYAKWKEGG